LAATVIGPVARLAENQAGDQERWRFLDLRAGAAEEAVHPVLHLFV